MSLLFSTIILQQYVLVLLMDAVNSSKFITRKLFDNDKFVPQPNAAIQCNTVNNDTIQEYNVYTIQYLMLTGNQLGVVVKGSTWFKKAGWCC